MLDLSLSNNYCKIKKFIEFRLQDDKYRGIHLFQHNRLTAEKVQDMLELFLEIGLEKILIPSGDEYSLKNPKGFKISKYPDYELFVKKVREKNKQGTPMTIKKILFLI